METSLKDNTLHTTGYPQKWEKYSFKINFLNKMLKIEMKIKFFVLVNTWASGGNLLYSTDTWW